MTNPSTHPARRLLAPALLVLALGLAGCGGGDAAVKTPDQLVAQGLDELGRYEFADAYASFAEAAARAPAGGALRRKAVFAQAVVCHQWQPASEARITEAAGLYRQLADAGEGEEAVQSLLRLGRLAELGDYFGDQEDLPKAREIYQQVMARWPQRAEAGEACLRLAAAWAQALDDESVRKGVAALDGWLQAHPDEPKAAIMLQYASELHWAFLHDAKSAVACLIEADRRGFDCDGREWQYCWRIARLAEEQLKDRELAIRYYRKIITTYPKSGSAWESQQELRRLGVEPPPIKLFDATLVARRGAGGGASAAAAKESKP
jgi:tetratricopeptide (TPR) repeat protein